LRGKGEDGSGWTERRFGRRLREFELLDEVTGRPFDEARVRVGDAASPVIAFGVVEGGHEDLIVCPVLGVT
jgi:hypothetical protein